MNRVFFLNSIKPLPFPDRIHQLLSLVGIFWLCIFWTLQPFTCPLTLPSMKNFPTNFHLWASTVSPNSFEPFQLSGWFLQLKFHGYVQHRWFTANIVTVLLFWQGNRHSPMSLAWIFCISFNSCPFLPPISDVSRNFSLARLWTIWLFTQDEPIKNSYLVFLSLVSASCTSSKAFLAY